MKVIGLDQYGYGRILGQCQLGSKLFYSMWATIAEDTDNFTCTTFTGFPLDDPEFKELGLNLNTDDDVKKFIRERILGRENEDLNKV